MLIVVLFISLLPCDKVCRHLSITLGCVTAAGSSERVLLAISHYAGLESIPWVGVLSCSSSIMYNPSSPSLHFSSSFFATFKANSALPLLSG